jgi:uncharacterized membrane protein
MTIYIILKFLHVLLAITAVGANITYGVWLSRAAREPAHLEYVLRGIKVLDDRAANPAFGLLLVSGVAMVFAGRIPWTTPWILTSLVLYIVLVLVGLFGYTPLIVFLNSDETGALALTRRRPAVAGAS